MKIPVTALVAACAALLALGDLPAAPRDNDTTRKYGDGVSLLNLLNGLNLTDEQQRRILELNKELKLLRDAYLESPTAKALDAEKESAMAALYNYLLNNPEKEDKAIQARAAKADHQVREYRAAAYKATAPDLERIAKEVEGLLSSQQLEVVNSFAPCVVPPKDMRDPIRAGQAKSSAPVIKALEQARELKKAKKDVAAFTRNIADGIVEHSNKKAKLSAEEEGALRAKVFSVVSKAIALSDTDFEIQKELLARDLEPVNKIEELRDEMSQRNPHVDPLDRLRKAKVVQFLVNPDTVIPALERRLAAGSPGGLKSSVSPSSTQPQENRSSGSWR